MNEDSPSDAVTTVGVLAEPVRRRLYDYVAGQRSSVGRDEAAQALGIGRPLAAFHLDRLVAAGLLATEFHRRNGRTGPGAGRPAKFYRRALGTVAVSLPTRRYEVAAAVFAEALERTNPTGPPDGLLEAAREYGRRLGSTARDEIDERPSRATLRTSLLEVLAAGGFEPEDDPLTGQIHLRNCPFAALVAGHREMTCVANLAIVDGIRVGLGALGLVSERVALPGYCCVALRPDGTSVTDQLVAVASRTRCNSEAHLEGHRAAGRDRRRHVAVQVVVEDGGDPDGRS